MPSYYAIIPAAGSGSRFGDETPKQYHPLAGRPLIYHSLAAFCRCPRIERVWVVLSPEDRWWRENDWTSLGYKLETLYCGGTSRSASVANALRAAATAAEENDWVLVHDAVRPCVTQELLIALCDELADDPVGGLLAVPLADTLKRADAEQRIACTEPRENLWQAQTPQMFRYGLLQSALAGQVGATDEASALEAAGFRPRLVRSEASNLKVTYPTDLRLAELILQARMRGDE